MRRKKYRTETIALWLVICGTIVMTACGEDGGGSAAPADASAPDSGRLGDGAAPAPDGAPGGDATTPDAGGHGGHTPDAATPDAATRDAGGHGGHTPDAATPDAAMPDGGGHGGHTPDAATPDAAPADAARPDAVATDGGGPVPCPDPNDPKVRYVSQDPRECDRVMISCVPGFTLFDDPVCGCGCIE